MTINLPFIFDFCAGGASGAFTPASRGSALVLWLQGSTITQSAGNVATWPDSSGNWTAATPNPTAPTYTASNASYNHLPTANYTNGSAQQLLVSSFAVVQPNTIYIVCNNTANGTNSLDGVTNREIIGFSGDWYYFAGGSSVVSSVATAGPHAVCVAFDGASSAMYIDSSGTAVGSGTSGTNGLSGGLFIGSSNAGAAEMTGSIAEIIITNVHDTLAQRQAMFGYLGTKYAQSWS